MSVHIIDGALGNGKTLYAMTCIIEELVNGKRYIVTNVPIKFAELQAYLDKYTDGVDVNERVRILTHEECFHFWCQIEEGQEPVPFYESREWQKMTGDEKKSHWAKYNPRGYMWVIDEAGVYVNSEDWKMIGRQAVETAAYIRKLSSILVLLAQHRSEIAKPFRKKVQDFTKCRNMGKEKRGFFRLPRVFQRVTTSDEQGLALQASREFRLDLEIANCYDTSGAPGLHDRAADKNDKPQGLHWGWAIAGFVVFLCVLAMIPRMMIKGAQGLSHVDPAAVRGTNSSSWANVTQRNKKPERGENVTQRNKSFGRSENVTQRNNSPEEDLEPNVTQRNKVSGFQSVMQRNISTEARHWEEMPVYLTAIIKRQGRFVVMLSDGRTFSQDDARLRFVGSSYVMIDEGERGQLAIYRNLSLQQSMRIAREEQSK